MLAILALSATLLSLIVEYTFQVLAERFEIDGNDEG